MYISAEEPVEMHEGLRVAMGGTEVQGNLLVVSPTLTTVLFAVRAIVREQHKHQLELEVIGGIETGRIFVIHDDEATIGAFCQCCSATGGAH